MFFRIICMVTEVCGWRVVDDTSRYWAACCCCCSNQINVIRRVTASVIAESLHDCCSDFTGYHFFQECSSASWILLCQWVDEFFFALAEGRRPFTGYAEGTLLTDYAIGAWFHKIAIEAGLGRGSHQLPPQPRTWCCRPECRNLITIYVELR